MAEQQEQGGAGGEIDLRFETVLTAENLNGLDAAYEEDGVALATQKGLGLSTKKIMAFVVEEKVSDVQDCSTSRIVVPEPAIKSQGSLPCCNPIATTSMIRTVVAADLEVDSLDVDECYHFGNQLLLNIHSSLVKAIELRRNGNAVTAQPVMALLTTPLKTGSYYEKTREVIRRCGIKMTCHAQKGPKKDISTVIGWIEAALANEISDVFVNVPIDVEEEAAQGYLRERLGLFYKLLRRVFGNLNPNQVRVVRLRSDLCLSRSPMGFAELAGEHINLSTMVSLSDNPAYPAPSAYRLVTPDIHGAGPFVKLNDTNQRMRQFMAVSLVSGFPVVLSVRMEDVCGNILDVPDLDDALGMQVREAKYTAKQRGRGPTHSLLAVGIDLTDDQPTYQVDNSWGVNVGNNGSYCMTTAWFSAHCYEIVVDRKFVSEDLAALAQVDPALLEHEEEPSYCVCNGKEEKEEEKEK